MYTIHYIKIILHNIEYFYDMITKRLMLVILLIHLSQEEPIEYQIYDTSRMVTKYIYNIDYTIFQCG